MDTETRVFGMNEIELANIERSDERQTLTTAAVPVLIGVDLASRIDVQATIYDGIPLYINPLLEPGTIRHHWKGTPQEFFVADSMETVRRAAELKR